MSRPPTQEDAGTGTVAIKYIGAAKAPNITVLLQSPSDMSERPKWSQISEQPHGDNCRNRSDTDGALSLFVALDNLVDLENHGGLHISQPYLKYLNFRRPQLYRYATVGNALAREYFENEALTCNVCDRSFPTRRQLADHQQKKRHFGCVACDSLFPSLMALEHHKEEFQHWSDSSCCSRSDSDDSDECHEDRHRLL